MSQRDTHSAKPGPWTLETLWALLRQDRPLQAFLGIFVALQLPYLLPGLDLEQRSVFAQLYSNFLFIPAVLLVFSRGLHRLSLARTRRFWMLLMGSLTAWWVVAMLYAVAVESFWTAGGELAVDTLYAVFYLLFFLALEIRPHGIPAQRAPGSVRRMQSSGLVVLLFGLLVYFVLVPNHLSRDVYDSWLPSLTLYVTLDLLLTAELLWLMTTCPLHLASGRRWWGTYALLATTTALWAVSDLFEGLTYARILDWQSGAPTEILWSLPWLPLVLAARLRHLPMDGKDEEPAIEAGDDDTGGVSPKTSEARRLGARLTSPLVLSAIVLPVVHLGVQVAGVLDESTRPAREMTALAVTLLLGVMALLEHHTLRRRDAELAKLERHLRQAQRIEALGELAGGVAHDFKNLVMVIQWHVGMGLRDLEPTSSARRDLEQIDKAARSAEQLARNLLRMSHRREIAPRPLDLGPVVEELSGTLRRLFGSAVEVEVDSGLDPLTIRADRAQFEQVLVNLCLNARDALAGISGTIRLELRLAVLDSPDSEGSRRLRPGRYGVVTVRDNGRGMSSEALSRVRELFFTTKEGGSGLGLAVADAILGRHSGALRIESSPGRGTAVETWWPAAATSEEACRYLEDGSAPPEQTALK